MTFRIEMGCSESGKYLTHSGIPTTGTTGVVLAEEVVSVLEGFDSVDTLKAVLLITSTTTGCETV